jgi:hypothetical protein
MFPACPHGRHYLALEEPAGLLAQPDLAAKFRAGHPVLGRAKEIDDLESLQKVKLDIMENSAGSRGNLVVAYCTFAGKLALA